MHRASAQELYDQGVNMLDSKDPARLGQALALIDQASKDELPAAQSMMADFYLNGLLLDKDLDKAVDLAQKATEGGDPTGHFLVGYMKLTGTGLPQDKKAAARHFKIAADGGVVQAMDNLSQMFTKGEGVPQDNRQAIEWMVKSAQTGGRFEDLMRRINDGTLDAESREKIGAYVDKYVEMSREDPNFMRNAASTGKMEKYEDMEARPAEEELPTIVDV